MYIRSEKIFHEASSTTTADAMIFSELYDGPPRLVGPVCWLRPDHDLAEELWKNADVTFFNPKVLPDILHEKAAKTRTCYLYTHRHDDFVESCCICAYACIYIHIHVHVQFLCTQEVAEPCLCPDVIFVSLPEQPPSISASASKMTPPRWPTKRKSSRRRGKVRSKCSRYPWVVVCFMNNVSERLAKTYKRPRGNMAL